jgi:hypothetical protein
MFVTCPGWLLGVGGVPMWSTVQPASLAIGIIILALLAYTTFAAILAEHDVTDARQLRQVSRKATARLRYLSS